MVKGNPSKETIKELINQSYLSIGNIEGNKNFLLFDELLKKNNSALEVILGDREVWILSDVSTKQYKESIMFFNFSETDIESISNMFKEDFIVSTNSVFDEEDWKEIIIGVKRIKSLKNTKMIYRHFLGIRNKI